MFTSGVLRTGLFTDHRETDRSASTSADLLEERGTTEVGDVVGSFEVLVCTKGFAWT